MATQIRDSPFGHMIRFLSQNKAFCYPRENGPFLKTRLDDLTDKASSDSSPQQTNNHSEAHDLESPIPTTVDDASTEKRRQDGLGSDVILVDWYGPDDPENPHNWSRGWKLLVLFHMCILNFSFYIASSIYVPGLASIMKEFKVSEVMATLGLSLFTFGYGLGPMLWSPMSEMPMFGRSGIYFWTLFAFILLQLPTGFATNMPMFLVFRFLTGFIGSPPMATGGATIIDMYDPVHVAYGICIYASFGVCGPVFGPVIGGFVAQARGWRWTIWVFTWLCAGVWVLFFFTLPETSASNILYRRAKRLRQMTGDDRYRSQSEIDEAHHKMKDHLVVLARAFTLTFTEPIVFLLDLYTALLYGVLFTWFESFPLVFGEIHHFNLGQQGLVFLGIFVGGIVTVPCYLLWVRYGIVPRMGKPSFTPERFLPPTFFGSASLPICLFWYGWSARDSMHWIMPIVGSAFFTVGVVTLFNCVLNYLGVAYPKYTASIFAGNTLFRASFGAIFPLFARQLFRELGIGGGNSLLGGIAICFIPIPFVFYKYGATIRGWSNAAKHDD